MAVSTSRRARGRPRVPDEARKRNNVTIRMRDGLKSKVEKSAVGQQRSLSEEIENRLERSFTEESAFGGPEARRMAILMGSSFAVAVGDADWAADPIVYSRGAAGVLDALLIGFPAGEGRALAVGGLIGRLLSRLEQVKEQDK